ncbi:hypothetical protein D9M68_847770 [compost metagenome]
MMLMRLLALAIELRYCSARLSLDSPICSCSRLTKLAMWRSGARRSCDTMCENTSRSLLAATSCCVRSATRFSSSRLRSFITSSRLLAAVMSRVMLDSPCSSPASLRSAVSTVWAQKREPSSRSRQPRVSH